MSQKIILTIYWMVIFAVLAFCVGLVMLFIIAATYPNMPDALLEPILWGLRVVLVLSPLVALFLVSREVLPGSKPLPNGTHGRNITHAILTFIVAIIGLLFAYGAVIAFSPPPGRPNVSIAILGYTNAADTRLAQIAVTNLSDSPVFAYQPFTVIPVTNEMGGLTLYSTVGGIYSTNVHRFIGAHPQWHSLIASKASASFLIATPTNQSPWKLTLRVYPDRGTAQVFIKRVVAVSCACFGLMPRYERMPYDIEGDWIQNGR